MTSTRSSSEAPTRPHPPHLSLPCTRSMTAQDCQDQLTRVGMDLVSGLTLLVWPPELGSTQRHGCQMCGTVEHACASGQHPPDPSHPHFGSSGWKGLEGWGERPSSLHEHQAPWGLPDLQARLRRGFSPLRGSTMARRGGVCSPVPPHTQEGEKHPEAAVSGSWCQGWKWGTHFLSHSPLGMSRPQSIRGAGAQTAESGNGNILPNYPVKSLMNFKCPFASNSSFTNAPTVCETSPPHV